MPFAELTDARLYYERAGVGPPLLIVGGSASDMRNRPNVMDWPLTESFDVVGYDHRGLGQSEAVDPVDQPTMADFASDALALVDHLGWDRFRLLGVSFGGMVAQEIALAAGNRLERMVLACTSSGGEGGSSYPLHQLYELDEGEAAERRLDIIDTRCVEDLELRKVFRAAAMSVPVTLGLMRQMEARRHHDTWDRLRSLKVPTLIAAGRYDGIAPLPNSEALARHIPTAHLEIFEGGHPFFVQDRRAFPAMIKFLAG